jgi:hypothetical protein
MQALPSIAFGGFSGSAKDVTARQVGGRTILSVRSFPTGPTTSAQVVRRASLSKISKSFKLLTADQMQGWDRLAEHCSGASVFGQKAEISGLNLYIRLNVSRTRLAKAFFPMPPLPGCASQRDSRTSGPPKTIVIKGIAHEAGYKMVVKMSAGQSAGVSSGLSKTVIITPVWRTTGATLICLICISRHSVSNLLSDRRYSLNVLARPCIRLHRPDHKGCPSL